MRTVRQALEHAPDLEVELGRARDLPAAYPPYPEARSTSGSAGYTARRGGPARRHRRPLVRLEPLDAVLGEGHPLAGREALRPAELAGSTLVLPAAARRLDYLGRFADRFGIADRLEGPNLGMDEFLERIRPAVTASRYCPPTCRRPSGPGWRRYRSSNLPRFTPGR